MTTAVVDSPHIEQGLPSRFLDSLVVERRFAPGTDTVVLETVPVGSTPALHENVRPRRRPPCLLARWVPDPRGEQSLICIWVPQNG